MKIENSRELHGWQAGPNTVTALLFGETINFKYAQPFNYYMNDQFYNPFSRIVARTRQKLAKWVVKPNTL